MNIKELKSKIADLPDNMDVFVEQTNNEYSYSLSNSGDVKNVRFIGEAEEPTEDCFVISDDI